VHQAEQLTAVGASHVIRISALTGITIDLMPLCFYHPNVAFAKKTDQMRLLG
jgi:hypothetical protein